MPERVLDKSFSLSSLQEQDYMRRVESKNKIKSRSRVYYDFTRKQKLV